MAFFDDISKKFSQASQNAVQKGKDINEIVKSIINILFLIKYIKKVFKIFCNKHELLVLIPFIFIYHIVLYSRYNIHFFIMKSIIKIDHLEKSNVNLNNNNISKQFKLTDTRKVIPGYIQNQSGNDYSGVSGKNEEMFKKSELWQNFERDFHKFMKEDYP